MPIKAEDQDGNDKGRFIPAKSDEVADFNNRVSKVAGVKPLVFYEIDEATGEPKKLDPRAGRRREQVWEMYFEKSLTAKKIKEVTKFNRKTINNDIIICTDRYNEWIDKFGLDIFGSPNQRLRNHIEELLQLLDEVKEEIKENKKEHMTAEARNNRRLQLDILRELSKFKGIEPPKEVHTDVTVTLAQESRKKMLEVFP